MHHVTRAARVPLAKPVFDDEMRDAAVQALTSERLVLGESVYRFEEEFARYCGTRFAVSMGSGTAALTLSLLALGIGGAEVVTSPASFVATANSIIHAGATPKFADITLGTYTIDPEKLSCSTNDRVKAIVPVHLYGFPASMKEICEIARRKNVMIVEDACQAHGALCDGRKVGSIGDVGCFSFFPSKNMTVGGDGGMAVTDNETIADCLVSLRDCGRVKGSRYVHDRVGFTERLNTVQAAIGRVQLRRLDKWNECRGKIASKYDDFLSDLGEVITPPRRDPVMSPVYHLYVLRCSRRDDLQEWLTRAGVETAVHYVKPIHLQPAYQRMFGHREGEFPCSETLTREALSIPMHPSLSSDEIQFVSESIHSFYRKESDSS